MPEEEEITDQPLTRSEKKKKNQLRLREIVPQTKNQELAFNQYAKDQNLLLHGYAGTGKTFISLYLALRDVITGYDEKQKVVIYRSVVPTRDMGFLKGTVLEKVKVYEEPYKIICSDLFYNRPDAYDLLKRKMQIEFSTTSFIRGLTIDDAIVIVDEYQNMNLHELSSLVTRLGNNSRIIFCGDTRQTDIFGFKHQDELEDFRGILKLIPSFNEIEFGIDDIVRSGIVKEYILAREQYYKSKNAQVD